MYRQAWSSTPYTVTYVSVPFGCSQMVSFIINWHTSVKGSPETKQNFKYQNKKKLWELLIYGQMGTLHLWLELEGCILRGLNPLT